MKRLLILITLIFIITKVYSQSIAKEYSLGNYYKFYISGDIQANHPLDKFDTTRLGFYAKYIYKCVVLCDDETSQLNWHYNDSISIKGDTIALFKHLIRSYWDALDVSRKQLEIYETVIQEYNSINRVGNKNKYYHKPAIKTSKRKG